MPFDVAEPTPDSKPLLMRCERCGSDRVRLHGAHSARRRSDSALGLAVGFSCRDCHAATLVTFESEGDSVAVDITADL